MCTFSTSERQKTPKTLTFWHFWLPTVLRATTEYTFSTSGRPKVVRACGVLYFFIWKCASRHNGVHFFNISSSKSVPSPSVFYTFDLEMCLAPQGRALFQHLIFQKCPRRVNFFFHFWLGSVLCATRECTFSASHLPKVVRARQFFTFLTWKCASRHKGVHFFSISSSKWSEPVSFLHFWLGSVLRATRACTFSASHLPKVVRDPPVFYTFDLEMCFAPQGRALFQHLIFQKWPGTRQFFTLLTWKCASRHKGVHFFSTSSSKSVRDASVFYTFDLEMCFAPQGRALFQHLIFQKWSETRQFFTLLTWERASRHSGVQFFISHLASWLRTRRFSELTFPPFWATNHWKHTVNRDFPALSRTCTFFLLNLSLLWSSHFLASPLWLFPPLVFHLSILSEVWLLNFLRTYVYIYIYIFTYIYNHKYIYI